MSYRTRIKYTDKQKTEIWDRWQRGESLKEIGRAFDRGSSSIYGQLSTTGGINGHNRGQLEGFGVAVISDILDADDPKEAAKGLL